MWPSPAANRSSALSDAASSVSGFSMASTARHNQFSPSTSTPGVASPASQVGSPPRAESSFGILVVGLGGANGATMLAGILANKLNIEWHGPKGEHMTPNYYGCITQLDSRGIHGGVGYRNVIRGLADANKCAVGGWDIRSDKLGDALLKAQILDYDLVRQVQVEMNKLKLFRGLFDPRFIGSSQHDTANYILTEQEAKSDAEALKCLRADIRYFKWRNGISGHTTVIWSASVEPNSDLVSQIHTADDLLRAIDMSEEQRGGPLPPSLMYATAAVLEGCSFVNGGSQNTLACSGLMELAQRNLGVYCLGTDFKAGQTKFKTAAVEYIRTMGLTPKVIASSNHLGNNDMRNLASAKEASSAKLKVKHDIFAPWEEQDLDHKVSIMFTPYINDDKRDFVEYTSLGFLGQTHTMVTYTRASDSVLCVPLMIDVAVWCAFFSQRKWPYGKVAEALSYLFKVPEGAARGVDPGFFHQMEKLRAEATAADSNMTSSPPKQPFKTPPKLDSGGSNTAQVGDWVIPGDVGIICAGLGCVDMQLNGATCGDGGEGIETFEGECSIGGGSVSMACKTIARLAHGGDLESPPIVSNIVPLCMIGDDDAGNKLLRLLEECGCTNGNVDTEIVRSAQIRVKGLRTALSVLPIYKDGRRGCFFDAASNKTFSAQQMIDMLSDINQPESSKSYGAFLFGYPHLLPLIQGQNLAFMFHEARRVMIRGGLTALDLNGVPDMRFPSTVSLRSKEDLEKDVVIGSALKYVDILHMNEDELALLTGCRISNSPNLEEENQYAISKAVDLFLACGVALVAVTRGKTGSFVACNNVERFRKSPNLPQSWANCSAHIAASELPSGTRLNTNGAGDSFTAGLLVAAMLRHTGLKTKSALRSHSAKSPSIRESPQKHSSTKKVTPYTLYMKEKYVALKNQYSNDKKKIFAKCHELWEKESPSVKKEYERRVNDNEEVASNVSGASWSASDFSDPTIPLSTPGSRAKEFGDPIQAFDTASQTLSLESAIQFASLIAANHVNADTRDLKQLDCENLLKNTVIFQEI